MPQESSTSDAARRSKMVARLMVAIAALMWSTSGLFAKSPIFDVWSEDIRGLMLAFWRAFFAGLILVPIIRRPRWHPLLVPLSVSFALMCLLYMTAMAHTTAANAIWLQATSPWWVFLISVVLLREPVSRRDLIPLGFGVLGVGIILVFELGIRAEQSDRFGVICGLASGVALAIVITLTRQLRDQGAAWLVALNHLVAVLVLLPWIVGLGIWPTIEQSAVLAAFGIFQMAIPYVIISRALRSISSQEAVAIILLEPILTPVWIYFFYDKAPETWTIAGATLIFCGLVLRYLVLGWREKS